MLKLVFTPKQAGISARSWQKNNGPPPPPCDFTVWFDVISMVFRVPISSSFLLGSSLATQVHRKSKEMHRILLLIMLIINETRCIFVIAWNKDFRGLHMTSGNMPAWMRFYVKLVLHVHENWKFQTNFRKIGRSLGIHWMYAGCNLSSWPLQKPPNKIIVLVLISSLKFYESLK